MEDGFITRSAKHVFDLLPAMRAPHGWITDKPAGFAVDGDAQAYVVTDNDGVDDWLGEPQSLRLGPIQDLFG